MCCAASRLQHVNNRSPSSEQAAPANNHASHANTRNDNARNVQDAGMDFTGTRFFTSLKKDIPRLNGTTEYVSKGIDTTTTSSTGYSNNGEP
jgi:hypothetical protein